MEFTQALYFPISTKVRLGSEIRRITCNGVYSDLLQDISQIFSIPVPFLVLQYIDDEGDLVHLSSQRELEEALKFSSNNLLRLTLSSSQPKSELLTPGAFHTNTESIETPYSESEISADNLLRIKLEMAEAKAKVYQLKRAKKECGRENWAQWKTEKQELISRIKQLKGEHKNLGRNPCYKAQRGCGGKFRARFISTQLKNHTFVPGENFTEVFRVRNEGDSAWPEGTVLIPIGKNADHDLLGSAGKAIPVGTANAGQCVDVQVPLHAPQAPGTYKALWRLATSNGSKFGQRLELNVSVCENRSDSEDECEIQPKRAAPALDWLGLLAQLEAMGWNDKPKNLRLLRTFNGNVSLVVAHLIDESTV